MTDTLNIAAEDADARMVWPFEYRDCITEYGAQNPSVVVSTKLGVTPCFVVLLVAGELLSVLRTPSCQ